MAKQFEIVQFGIWNHNKVIINLVQLEKVINWLEESSLGPVTMKEVKNHFPNWETVGGDIGEWVEQGLLVRTDRRYAIGVKRVEAIQVAAFTAQAQKESRLLLANMYKTEPTLKKNPWLLLVVVFHLRQRFLNHKSLAFEKDTYVFEKVSFYEAGPYVYVEKVSESEAPSSSGLASYFLSDEKMDKFQEILNIIGDVNPIFFLTMTGRMLELLNENQRITRKKNSIFLDTLSKLNYIEKDPLNYYNPYPIIEVDNLVFESTTENITKCIENYLNKLKEMTPTESEFVLLTGMILNELLQSVNEEKHILKLV